MDIVEELPISYMSEELPPPYISEEYTLKGESDMSEEYTLKGEPHIDMLVLISEDGKEYKIPKNIASKCEMIKTMLEVNNEQDIINLPNIVSDILEIVIEHILYHDENDKILDENKIKEWDNNFIKELHNRNIQITEEKEKIQPEPEDFKNSQMDIEKEKKLTYGELLLSKETSIVKNNKITTYLILASNYLGYKPLLELSINTIRDKLATLSAHDLRIEFNLPDDLTEEEKNQVDEEIPWERR